MICLLLLRFARSSSLVARTGALPLFELMFPHNVVYILPPTCENNQASSNEIENIVGLI